MKTRTRIALGLAVAASAAFGTAGAQTGVSIGINQPGVYGRIDIGNAPRPSLYGAQPVIVAPPRGAVQRQPVYLYVPPAQRQNWRRYCGQYGACGQPVYFVREEWVRERYEHEHRGADRGRHQGWDKHDGRRDQHGPDRGNDRKPPHRD